MKAFLFPGQGSQEVGMGADLFKRDPESCRLVDLASECAGADLRTLCLRGPERDLQRTEWLQPLLVAVSLGYHANLIRRGLEPDLVLGHSLGEITALAAAGVLTPEEAVQVAAHRGQFMGAAARQCEGGMLAVLSPRRGEVLRVLSDLLQTDRLFTANDNSPSQLILSGPAEGLAAAAASLAAAKLGPCRRLPVAGPWHSSLMRQAQRAFAAWLEPLPLRAPSVPILMNVSALPESDPETIRLLAVRNLTEPVQWRTCMERLAAMRPCALFEVGPGRVLSGLARANGLGDPIQIFNVNNDRGLELAAAGMTRSGAAPPPSPQQSLALPSQRRS